jgi:hypothetical protein
MARCKTCEAPIVWATHKESGMWMPLVERPVPKGMMVLVAGQTWRATEEDRRLHRLLYTSHFAAVEHRRR